MPWCEQCAKFWNPSSMNIDGTCPTCGRDLGRPPAPVSAPTAAEPVTAKDIDLRALAGEEKAKAPWHFKLLLVALVLYLGWRLVQVVLWVVR